MNVAGAEVGSPGSTTATLTMPAATMRLAPTGAVSCAAGLANAPHRPGVSAPRTRVHRLRHHHRRARQETPGPGMTGLEVSRTGRGAGSSSAARCRPTAHRSHSTVVPLQNVTLPVAPEGETEAVSIRLCPKVEGCCPIREDVIVGVRVLRRARHSRDQPGQQGKLVQLQESGRCRNNSVQIKPSLLRQRY